MLNRCRRRKSFQFEQLESRHLLAVAAIVDDYTDKWSYVPGETVDLYLNGETAQQDADLTIYNAAILPHSTFVIEELKPQVPDDDAWKNGFGYESHASFTIPEDMPSGIYYFGEPEGLIDGRGGKQIPFIVKDPDKTSDIVYLTSTNTPNAYSEKGGESAYTQYATDKTPTVSFERPRNTHFRTRSINSWMLQQDYDYRVIGDGEMDDYSELQNSRLLIVAGHNEYWTEEAKDSYDRFVQEGGSVMILGGNTMYRKVEYPSDTTMKVLGYWDASLVLQSIGMNYHMGGRGNTCGHCSPDIGFGGYRIIHNQAPFFEGVNFDRGDLMIMRWTSEFDGFPNLGLDNVDATGFPIIDPAYSTNFHFFDVYGFEIAQGQRATLPRRTLGGWIEYQDTPTTGRVINTGASDWGNYAFRGVHGNEMKMLTGNMIEYLLGDTHSSPPPGDFDFNKRLEIADIDRLTQAVRNQSSPVWKYDVNTDGQLTNSDREAWMTAKGTNWGDTNLDGVFNSTDLIMVLEAGEYEDGIEGNSSFAEGDWNGDGDFNSSDLIFAFVSGSYSVAAKPTQANLIRAWEMTPGSGHDSEHDEEQNTSEPSGAYAWQENEQQRKVDSIFARVDEFNFVENQTDRSSEDTASHKRIYTRLEEENRSL